MQFDHVFRINGSEDVNFVQNTLLPFGLGGYVFFIERLDGVLFGSLVLYAQIHLGKRPFSDNFQNCILGMEVRKEAFLF